MADDSAQKDPRAPSLGYGFAGSILVVAAATLARLALDPLLGNTFPYTTYFVAAAVDAAFGRTRNAILTLVGGGLLATVLFVPPRYSFLPIDFNLILGLAVYLVVGSVVVAMIHTMRVARRRVELLLKEVSARERKVFEDGERWRTTLASIGDAVITTDTAGRVTNLNPIAEMLTGWRCADAAGLPLETVFRIVNEGTRLPVENPAMRALREGAVVGLANHTILIAKDGTERPIDDSAAPIRDKEGTIVGCVLVFHDITERHKAERSLRESEERAAFVRRASGVGFWYCDLPFDVLQWDDLVKAHFHLLPNAPVTIDTFYARIHPDDREPTRRAIERSIRDKTGYDTEYRTVDPDTGATKWVRAIGRTFYAANGAPIRFDGVTLDVTSRKRAEETIRASETRNAFLVTLADTLRPLSDPVAVQAEASRMLGEHLGANRVVYFEIRGDEYVVERDYTSGTQPLTGRYPVASFGNELLARLLAGQTIVESDATSEPTRPAAERAAFEAIQVRGHVDVPLVKEGRFVAGLTVQVTEPREWSPASIALIEETAERTWAAVERAKAEAAFTHLAAVADRERRLFAAVLSSTPDFIYTFDLSGRFVYVNTPLLELWGKRLDEAVGRNFYELDYPPALAERLHRQIQEVIDTQQPLRDETPYTSGLGDRMYEYIFVPVVGENGVVEAVAGSTRDITERKLAEVERERLVGQLQEQDQRKDVFLATLAHELRNPLAPIRNGLQVLRFAGASGVVEQARAMMDRQLTQLVRLVDDLLDVSRVTQGKLELRKEPIELRAIVEAAVETSRPLVEHAGHELIIDMKDESVYVNGDLTRLAQVVSNLLTNSAKYTPRGGHIHVTVRSDGEQAVVSVRDDGIGIPKAMLDQVFVMFTQVDRALEKTTGGLGIGLSLVKGFIEMHGGTIEARSEGEGCGSEFVVRLPVATPCASAPMETDERGGPSLRRILVVDDNADAADSLGQLLELLGNEVQTAYDGEAAVGVVETFAPDVVLMDIGMPRMNGYDAARRIRERQRDRGVVLVALTGWGQEDDRRKSMDAGFDHHLVKPVELKALTEFLGELKASPGSESIEESSTLS